MRLVVFILCAVFVSSCSILRTHLYPENYPRNASWVQVPDDPHIIYLGAKMWDTWIYKDSVAEISVHAGFEGQRTLSVGPPLIPFMPLWTIFSDTECRQASVEVEIGPDPDTVQDALHKIQLLISDSLKMFPHYQSLSRRPGFLQLEFSQLPRSTEAYEIEFDTLQINGIRIAAPPIQIRRASGLYYEALGPSP
jgi:hypothetical protein